MSLIIRIIHFWIKDVILKKMMEMAVYNVHHVVQSIIDTGIPIKRFPISTLGSIQQIDLSSGFPFSSAVEDLYHIMTAQENRT